MAHFFISYSHADESLKDRFLQHCAILKRERNHFWEDRQLLAGDTLDPAIAKELKQADVIILLVSADFLDSYYCYEIEFQAALERHKLGEARILAIILDHCDWSHTPLKNVVNLPQDAKPIMDWQNQNQAWHGVVSEIRRVIASFANTNKTLPNAELLSVTQASLANNTTTTTPSTETPNIPKVTSPPTDLEYRTAARKAFAEIRDYYESGVKALNQQNSDYSAEITEINNQRFVASLYKDGNAKHEVVFWLGSFFGSRNGITYLAGSHISHTSENSSSGHITFEHKNHTITPKLENYSLIGSANSKGSFLDDVWELFIHVMKW